MEKLGKLLLKSSLVLAGALLPLAVVTTEVKASESGGVFIPSNAFYVSKEGNNTDGRTWKTAWNELDQIKWDQVSMPRPGKTVVNIDGGKRGMYYYKPMKVTVATKIPMYGIPLNWAGIEIKRSEEKGHDGQVVIDGLGRVQDLITINNQGLSTEFKGMRWKGIRLRGFTDSGIRVYGDNVSLSGIEIDGLQNSSVFIDNADTSGLSTSPPPPPPREFKPQSGVSIQSYSKTPISFEAKGLIVHDTVRGFTMPSGVKAKISKAWVYQSNYSYSFPGSQPLKTTGIECGRDNDIGIARPSDPMPYFGYPANVHLNDCVIGPALSTGLLVGSYSDVTANNCLLLNATQCNIRTPDSGWGTPGVGISGILRSQHLTSIMSAVNNERKGHDFVRDTGFTSNLRMSESIVYGGNVVMPKVKMGAGNFQFRTTGNTTAISAKQVNPLFLVNLDKIPYSVYPSYWSQIDYSLMPFSPARGAGSKLTSVRRLLAMPIK
ncbi:MAG: hypothetical protein K2X77_27995 [Candidatus Obscuribacterales bacterium]|nr:hypothetical protein [Candidatus Obscuribacterales bacterium]